MKPFRTKRLTRQEMERTAIELGAKLRTVQQWRYRGIPSGWQLKLMKHFGAAIFIDDVASAGTLADMCRERVVATAASPSHFSRQEVERAAIELGAKFHTVQQWRYRRIPSGWQLKLMKHFGAPIFIDDCLARRLSHPC
jgi:DNA-binding transcriptional regulator YiaG